MADVKALALSAQRKLENGDATTEVVAIRKAINGVGIFDKKDVERLMSQVGMQFARNKGDKRRLAERRRVS